MKKIVASLLIMPLMASIPASAQQFGLKMGQTVSQIKTSGIKLTKENGSTWSATYLPYGNKMFDDYRMLVMPRSGLCRINAYISQVPDTKYGDRTKDKYESIKDSLDEKYGPGKEFNYLRSGAIWKDSDEWMWSMYKGERVLTSYWDATDNKLGKRNLKSIQLKVVGLTADVTMISVGYEFSNIDSCVSEAKASNGSNL
jgi:hypothetical protein